MIKPNGGSGPKTSHSGATDIGLGREANEDSFLIAPPLFVVADGIGGHAAGDVASQTAVEVLEREMNAERFDLARAIESANREVFEKASGDSALSGMGTTMTALVTVDDSIEIAHVGDSRAYLLRSRTLRRLTRDHTFVERLVREGRITSEEAEYHPQRSSIERALGMDATVEIDRDRVDAMPGDRLMLCTDGLTTMLSDNEITQILLEETESTAASQRLVSEAVQAGASDNVTVVIVDLPGEAPSGVPGGDLLPEKSASELIVPTGAKSRRRSRRLPLILAAILIVLAISVGGGRAAILSSWYVGADGDRVTVFRGVPGSFGGIEIRKEVETTDVRVEELPEVYQRRVFEGISAEDAADARRIVQDLKDLAESPLESEGPTP